MKDKLYVQADSAEFYLNNSYPDDINEWIHYCHIYDGKEYKIFRNSHLEGKFRPELPNQFMFYNGSLRLGKHDDNYDKISLCGSMTSLIIWQDVISAEEIALLSEFKIIPRKEIFASDMIGTDYNITNGYLKYSNVTFRSMLTKDICKKLPNIIMFVGRFDMKRSQEICKYLGTTPFVPDTEEENIYLYNLRNNYRTGCTAKDYLWIAVTDAIEEGTWKKISNNTIISNSFFFERDGGVWQNCGIMTKTQPGWKDAACDFNLKSCATCLIQKSNKLNIKGMCFEYIFQTYFDIRGYYNKAPYFFGYYGWIIYKAKDDRTWFFVNDKGTTVASTKIKRDSWPLGRKIWTIATKICGYEKNDRISLILSVCKNDQFTCDNYACIHQDLYCDGFSDCSDYSDENNCKNYYIPDSYSNLIKPENVSGLLKDTNPLIIDFEIDIIRITRIDESRNNIGIEYESKVMWVDTRLTYYNLVDKRIANQIGEDDFKKIWLPKLNYPTLYNGNHKNIYQIVMIQKLAGKDEASFNDIYSGLFVRQEK